MEVDTHWHDVFEIVKCMGSGSLFLEGKTYEYNYGDILFVPCRFLHGYKESVKGKYSVFFICAENLLSKENTDLAGISALQEVTRLQHPKTSRRIATF